MENKTNSVSNRLGRNEAERMITARMNEYKPLPKGYQFEKTPKEPTIQPPNHEESLRLTDGFVMTALANNDRETLAKELERASRLAQELPDIKKDCPILIAPIDSIEVFVRPQITPGQRARADSFIRAARNLDRLGKELEMGRQPVITSKENGHEVVIVNVTSGMLLRFKKELLRIYGELKGYPQAKAIVDAAQADILGLPDPKDAIQGVDVLLNPDVERRENEKKEEIARKDAELAREQAEIYELRVRFGKRIHTLLRSNKLDLFIKIIKGIDLFRILTKKQPTRKVKVQDALLIDSKKGLPEGEKEVKKIDMDIPSDEATDWINDLLSRPL